MAAAGVGLDVFLDFLDDTDENYEQEGLQQTPRIDQVLQKYKEPLVTKETKHDTSNNNNDGRLLVIEKQLAELLENNQKKKGNCNESRSQGRKSRLQKSVGGVSPAHSDSDGSSPLCQIRETSKRNVGSKRQTASTDERIRSQLRATRISTDKDRSKRNSKKERDVRELDRETERRWKAEQAAIKLAEHVRTLQLQVHQCQQKQEVLVVQSSTLESSLVKEREAHSKAKEERNGLKSSRTDILRELEAMKRKCNDQSGLLKELESQLDRQERERIQYSRRLRDAEITVATSERETTLKDQTVTKLQQQIHDLQELLAMREQEHMKELNRLKPLSDFDVKHLVDKEVEKEKIRTESAIAQYKERSDQQMRSYRDLEEEFRTALRIEASRYQQLEQSYEKTVNGLAACQDSLETLKEKDTKSTGLVTELTTIVKEQKGRIVELSSGRQEILRELRDKTRVAQDEGRGRVKMEERASVLKEENDRLSAKLTAQESVITGLREERKLWGQELALQGASLAQDRGKMEGRIDSLDREVKDLRDKLEHCNSALKVKDKVIQDESQTIKALKEQISNYKSELSSVQADWSSQLNSLQNQYDQEKEGCQDLQYQMDMMMEEKRELEKRLREIEERDGTWKDKYRSLKAQWDERVLLIASLEESVHQLQEKSRLRHQQLEQERDKAIEEMRDCEKQLSQVKRTYKEQLISQETLMRQKLEVTLEGKEREVMEARGRMDDMEREMRVMLEESAKERKTMEDKFQRLSKTFHELQKELT